MSDTDDTDALLTCDPGGGLAKLLGDTMDGFSSQLESGSPRKDNKRSAAPVPKADASVDDGENGNLSRSRDDTSLDVSDYFNSEGELVLSGVSQFSETSYDEINQSKILHEDSSGENADQSDSAESVASSTSTAESNTVVTTVGKQHLRFVNTMEDGPKILNDAKQKRVVPFSQVDKSAEVPAEVQKQLQRQLVQANSSNPNAQSILEQNSANISYGVLNLNLNDLKTFAEGLSLCNIFPQTAKVNTFVPTQNDKGEQVFVRAPNFRTPGGYKPPTNPTKCRDLTDEQIQEEVRKMYAFPDGDEENGTNSDEVDCANKAKEVPSKSDDGKSKVDFNFLEGSPVPNEFGKGKSGKSIKRKLIPQGSLCGGTVGSVPDLGFGLRSLSADEGVIEPLVEKTVAWTTGKANESNAQPGMTLNSSAPPKSFSFGFGEEVAFSPIKPSTSSHQDRIIQTLFQNERKQPTPLKDLPVPEPVITTSVGVSANLSSPSAVGSQTECSQSQSISRASSSNSVVKISKQKQPTPKRRPIKKAASKHRGMASHFQEESSTHTKATAMSSNGASIAEDLEKILSELDIPSDELESLIENLDDSDEDGAVGFFEGIDTFDGNLVDALSGLKLESWQRQDNKVSEKYHDERVKREQCEKELRKLQEIFLAEKQQNAVLEATLKRRNTMLVQITVAFNRVCKEWKKFDEDNKSAVSKLQHDQKILAAACKSSRERIKNYELELHKTLEMAESFKAKLNDVQTEKDESITFLKETNSELEEKIGKLKEDMERLQNERDATLRALREAQIKLDEDKFSFQNMESHIKTLEERDQENVQKFEELLQAKAVLDANLIDITTRKNELENMIVSLRSELQMEKSNKDQLRKTLMEEADLKNKAEAERLHEYYNKKVQEILKAATDEATNAESLLKEQMRKAAIESEKRLTECKEKYLRELESVRSKYETEIETLKRENIHKQLLISSTVKQLQMGDSNNLTPLITQLSRIPHSRRDNVDVPTQQPPSNPAFKTSVSNLTKYTLDHLPSVVQIQQNGESSSSSGGTACETGKGFVRYKTPQPNVQRADNINSIGDANGGGDFRRSKNIGHQIPSYGDGTPRPYSENKVCSDSVPLGGNATGIVDFKNILSNFLETPVKPEKEQMNTLTNPGKLSDTMLDPALQKCIQELLKSYSEKNNNNGKRHVSSSSTSVVSVHVGFGGNNQNNDLLNKYSDNEFSANFNSDKNQIDASTSTATVSGQVTSRSDSNKCKFRTESVVKNQQSSSSDSTKPPWK